MADATYLVFGDLHGRAPPAFRLAALLQSTCRAGATAPAWLRTFTRHNWRHR